jgi:prepilin-type N-terminal cleavage/methylation domain-containing protein
MRAEEPLPSHVSICPRPGRIHGFTLLEVLVVVAIIALLAAILIPSTRLARQHSRRLACQTNVRQLAMAWQTYLDANNGKFLQFVDAHIKYGGIQGRLSTYVGPRPLNRHLGLPRLTRDAPVFRCPDDSGGANYTPSCYQAVGTSYFTNLLMIGDPQPIILPDDPCNQPPSSANTLKKKIKKRIRRLSRNAVTSDPTRLVLLGEYGWVNDVDYQQDPNPVFWHGRVYAHNLAFMDGHAAFVTMEKGMLVMPNYTEVPFRDLLVEASACQGKP